MLFAGSSEWHDFLFLSFSVSTAHSSVALGLTHLLGCHSVVACGDPENILEVFTILLGELVGKAGQALSATFRSLSHWLLCKGGSWHLFSAWFMSSEATGPRLPLSSQVLCWPLPSCLPRGQDLSSSSHSRLLWLRSLEKPSFLFSAATSLQLSFSTPCIIPPDCV